MSAINYRHLHYFWVVAKEGGIARAADRLGIAVQTVGTQVHELERSLGYALLKPAGRGVALTEAGHTVLRQADQIFQLGENIPALLKDALSSHKVRLTVGVSDNLPKLVVLRLLRPILQEPQLHLICHDDEFERLLGDLALHRLDLVLSDRMAAPNPNIKLYSHPLGSTALAWYATPALCETVAHLPFPQKMAQLPVVLPTTHSAVRLRLDQWFERHGIRPRIVGEFEDSALLETFASGGLGAFPAADLVREDLTRRYGVSLLGPCDGVEEHFYAIGTEKKVQHPLVNTVLHGAGTDRP